MTSYEEAEAQLSEVDLLSSMFPSEEEFSVTDQLALAELRDYTERRAAVTPTFQVQFTLTMKLGDADAVQHVLSLHCSYPPHYPNVPPEIVVRSPSLVRTQQAQLNSDLSAYLRSNCTGDVCVLSAIEWVQDNADIYLDTAPPTDSQKGAAASEDAIFTRLWIYSHHIYNKQKRKYILEWSKELGLSGFSMPGKPGIVCVEGAQEPCEEFWSRIRKLTWKRILIRHREDVPLSSSTSGTQTEIQKLRKFPALEEKAFDVHGSRGNHMDLGQLYQFLQEKGCAEVFPMYFGIEGR
ncbi:RWD domain-containing protein 2B isoform 1-T2 [Anomaloglossus baeobatrachus]|uniref:RWD domain-containing protein 2B n=1 Tax=Anomaloglossus baeobatrachus TaxID=238106 RepID=UPI003F4F6EC3